MYQAAVIGLGFIGAGDQVSGDALGQKVENLDGTHAQALAAHDRIALVAGSSRDEGRRKRFTERTGVPDTYRDWRQMLDAEDLDIVSVATYTPWHAGITIACAEAGVRAVICEKPLATSLRDADRMIEACRQHDTLLVINHPRRWHPLWRMVRDEIRTGAVGEVSHLSVHWPSGRLGAFGTHMFDGAAMLLGSRPEAVSGTIDSLVPPDCRGPAFHDPGGWGIVRFGEDVRMHVEASPRLELPPGFRVVGSLGWIEVGRETAEAHRWDGRTRTITCPTGRPSSLAIAVDELVARLSGEGNLEGTDVEARDALEVIMGFHLSSRLDGRWVTLPLKGDERTLEVAMG